MERSSIKHGAEKAIKTDIMCKFFLEAIEEPVRLVLGVPQRRGAKCHYRVGGARSLTSSFGAMRSLR